MRLLVSRTRERLRTSLFFIPMVAVLLAIALGLGSLAVDQHLGTGQADLPLGVASTVDSARALLAAIAGATISFAGVAFSVSLLIIQLASSQHSPRVVQTLFRDPTNKRVLGLVVGTFTYCLVVLRAVRSALDEGGEPVVPNLSVALGVLLGIASVLAVVAFISHSAHTMDVSEILERVTTGAIDQLRSEWPEAGGGHDEAPPRAPVAPGHVVRFDRRGWIRQLDLEAMLAATPQGATTWVDAAPGRYAVVGSVLCTVSPPPEDPAPVEEALRSSVDLGSTRSAQQDVSYGLRQLADIALRALSPGVNDPTTAQDAIFRAADVVVASLRRDRPPAVRSHDGATVVLAHQPSHDDLVRLAFEEVRRAAASHPAVCTYLLEAIHVVVEVLEAEGLGARTAELRTQARLVREGCEASGNLADDVAVVRRAYQQRFG